MSKPEYIYIEVPTVGMSESDLLKFTGSELLPKGYLIDPLDNTTYPMLDKVREMLIIRAKYMPEANQ